MWSGSSTRPDAFSSESARFSGTATGRAAGPSWEVRVWLIVFGVYGRAPRRISRADRSRIVRHRGWPPARRRGPSECLPQSGRSRSRGSSHLRSESCESVRHLERHSGTPTRGCWRTARLRGLADRIARRSRSTRGVRARGRPRGLGNHLVRRAEARRTARAPRRGRRPRARSDPGRTLMGSTRGDHRTEEPRQAALGADRRHALRPHLAAREAPPPWARQLLLRGSRPVQPKRAPQSSEPGLCHTGITPPDRRKVPRSFEGEQIGEELQHAQTAGSAPPSDSTPNPAQPCGIRGMKRRGRDLNPRSA
jgi:hypothetical protein